MTTGTELPYDESHWVALETDVDVAHAAAVEFARWWGDPVPPRGMIRKMLAAVNRAANTAETQVRCPDPGPCLHGPDPHQRRPSCQPDRDGA